MDSQKSCPLSPFTQWDFTLTLDNNYFLLVCRNLFILYCLTFTENPERIEPTISQRKKKGFEIQYCSHLVQETDSIPCDNPFWMWKIAWGLTLLCRNAKLCDTNICPTSLRFILCMKTSAFQVNWLFPQKASYNTALKYCWGRLAFTHYNNTATSCSNLVAINVQNTFPMMSQAKNFKHFSLKSRTDILPLW